MPDNDVKTNGTETNPSSEDDPCLEDSKRSGRGGATKNTDFFRRCRNEIAVKSGLSHKGVYVVGGIVIFAVILLIVVIAMAVAWPRMPHEFRYRVCAKSECLEAAAQIRQALDTSISPCEDLWNATCGGWLRKHPLPRDKSVWNMKQQLVLRETERVRDLIATLKLPLHTSTVQWKLKHLYEACIDVDTVNSDEVRPLKDIINELGGWYILRDFNDADFDKNAVIQKLHVRYGVSPFFQISVEPNPNIPGQNTIRISPGGLGLPDKEYYYRDQDDPIQIAYREYIRDVVIYMSTARNEATKFGTDMFFYEKRIAEITPDTITLQNPITTYNAISLSELKEIKSIPFFDILQAMYPESNITENTEVLVSSLEYLEQISQIMVTTDRKTMNGYLTWTLVRKYIPYLSKEYTSALHTFTSALYGTHQPLQRWEMCAALARKFMGVAVGYYEEKKHPMTEATVKIVNNTFASIVNVVKHKVETFKPLPLLYNHLKSKLSSLRIQVGVPEAVKQEQYLKEYFLRLKIQKSNLFESVLNAVRFQKKLEERRLNRSPEEDGFLDAVFSEVPKVGYLPSENAVVVPRSLLMGPLFEENYPSSIIFGRLGVEIAEAVVSAVLPYDSLWTSNRKILTPYHMTVNESLDSIQESVKCLQEYIFVKSKYFVQNVVANETSLKTLIHLSAVDVAREALKTSLEGTEHIHQPSLEKYEDAALFFLSYAQSQCSESTSQQQLYENIINFELPQHVRLNLVWGQVPGFAESLGCNFDEDSKCRDIF